MKRRKVLHIADCNKFLPPFIDLISECFDPRRHEFQLTIADDQKNLQSHHNVSLYDRTLLKRLAFYLRITIRMHQAEKIILHGLFDVKLVGILFFMPWLLKRCYWIMWGGDLYVHQLEVRNWKWTAKEFLRRPVIRRMGFLVNGTVGDVDLARKWYNAKGKHIKCFNYPSNIYKDFNFKNKKEVCLSILVGNSADPTNNHLEVFDKLEAYKHQTIKIFVPLSYGNQDYAKKIVDEGKKRFGHKFEPLLERMPLTEYLDFLTKIDIAIFNHRRQQAFGNAISLLGFGKKVYLNPASTLNDVFSEYKVSVFDINNLKLDLLDDAVSQKNIFQVKTHFSKESLVESLARWIQ